MAQKAKHFKTRVQNKHATEAQWREAINFIPLAGELIIYDIDDTHSTPRFKIGDGIVVWNDEHTEYTITGTKVNDLPFASDKELNIKNSEGDYSIQQIQDPADKYATGIQIKSKNLNAATLDTTLTDEEPIGAIGAFATSLGGVSSAQGKRSVAEGTNTVAKGAYSHAEGDNSVTLGNDSHAEGYTTVAKGQASHSEGSDTQAIGDKSHAEGYATIALGNVSHAEGVYARAEGTYSHAEGDSTIAFGEASHAEGHDSQANGQFSHAEGLKTIAKSTGSHAEGAGSKANGSCAHAEGYDTEALGESSHAEGFTTLAEGDYSHAEGERSVAKGRVSHAEGQGIANGELSHAEGVSTTGEYATYAHAEGRSTANGMDAHSEGNQTIAKGSAAHAEGYNTRAKGDYSHASGAHTVAEYNGQFVTGRYNARNTDALFIIGNGSSDNIEDSPIVGEYMGVGEYCFVIYIPDSGIPTRYVYYYINSLEQFNAIKKQHTDYYDIEYYPDHHNAFQVYNDGHAEVQTMGETDNSVVIRNGLKTINGESIVGSGDIKVISNITPDWDQWDSTQPDYIKNKTHGVITAGKEFAASIDDYADSSLIKVSDEIVTIEELQNCIITINVNGEEIIISKDYTIYEIEEAAESGITAIAIQVPWTYFDYDAIMIITAIDYNKIPEGTPEEEIPTPGVYFFDTHYSTPSSSGGAGGMRYNLYTTKLQLVGEIKQLDEKYLPDMKTINGQSVFGKGNIEIATTNIQLSIYNTLPEATETMRGRMIIVPEGNTDKLYICLSIKGVYTWVSFDDTNVSGETTSILGQATLGSLILGKE